MAKELYYFVNKTHGDTELLLELIDKWLENGYSNDDIRNLMWLYYGDIAFLTDKIEVNRDGEVNKRWHTFIKDDKLEMIKCEDQSAFKDYIIYNTEDGNLLEHINLSQYDVYYII